MAVGATDAIPTEGGGTTIESACTVLSFQLPTSDDVASRGLVSLTCTGYGLPPPGVYMYSYLNADLDLFRCFVSTQARTNNVKWKMLDRIDLVSKVLLA